MIVLHAGGDRGFVPGAELLFKAKSASGDYYDEMNHVNFVASGKASEKTHTRPASKLRGSNG